MRTSGEEAAGTSPEGRQQGDCDQLFGDVYDELKRMAHHRLSAGRERALDTTELVHELYLRMGSGRTLQFERRAEFFSYAARAMRHTPAIPRRGGTSSYAARAMRHLLLDRARDCQRLRAGGGWLRVTLDADDAAMAIGQADEVIAIEEALQQLAAVDERAARVLELRYFAGLSIDQTAEMLGVAPRSVDRDWQFARAFLHDLLAPN